MGEGAGQGGGRDGSEMVYIAVGSNLGDREGALVGVIEAIEKDVDLALLQASSVYETEPVGPPDQDYYLNAVLAMSVRLAPLELLSRLHGIERSMGRDRGSEQTRWGPRRLDLDILLFGDRQMDTALLVIPHARAHERNFVMVPLAEIAPALVHPVLGCSVTEIARSLPALDVVYAFSQPCGWPSASRASGPEFS